MKIVNPRIPGLNPPRNPPRAPRAPRAADALAGEGDHTWFATLSHGEAQRPPREVADLGRGCNGFVSKKCWVYLGVGLDFLEKVGSGIV